MYRAVALAVGMAGVVAAGVALAQGENRGRSVAPDQCVSRPFDQTRVIDEQTLFVNDRHGRAVLLHMSGACLLSSREPIGLEFRGASSRICGPLDVDVIGTVTTTPTRCIIASVEALTAEQAAAYQR